MKKDVAIVLGVSILLVVGGVLGIVYLAEQFPDLNLNTGFGLIPKEISGIPTTWIVSIVLLVIALALFYLFVLRKKKE